MYIKENELKNTFRQQLHFKTDSFSDTEKWLLYLPPLTQCLP